jgi:hypothetical protein
MKNINQEKWQKSLLLSLIIGIPTTGLIFIQERLSAFLPLINFKGIPFTLSFLQMILTATLITFLLLTFIKAVMPSQNLKFSKSTISVSSTVAIVVIYLTTLSGYWKCFYFVPDSALWLADPVVHTTVRPGVMRWFYELFLSKEEIAFNFYEDPDLVYNTFICNKNHPFQDVVQFQVTMYFISLLFLTLALVKFLKWKHAILFTLIVTSGYQGSGEYNNNLFDSISHMFIGVIVAHDLFKVYQKVPSENFLVTLRNSALFITLFFSFMIPLGYFSFLPPEINSVQSEAIVFSLINFMIAVAIVLSGRLSRSTLLVFFGILLAGIALVSRLATMGTVILFLIYFLIFIWKKTKSVKYVSIGLVLALLPTFLINQSSYKPESSMSFWGPVAYSLYVIDNDDVEVTLTKDEELFSDRAIELVESHFEKASIEPKAIQPVWLSMGNYLYYGAAPAFNSLKAEFSQDYEMNEFFKNFAIKVFVGSSHDFISKYIQNAQVALGFYNPSLFPPVSDSTSKVFYGPFMLLLFMLLAWSTHKKGRTSQFLVLAMTSSIFFLGAVVASIFDGPSIRNVGINDIYLLPLILFGYGIAMGGTTSNSDASRED